MIILTPISSRYENLVKETATVSKPEMSQEMNGALWRCCFLTRVELNPVDCAMERADWKYGVELLEWFEVRVLVSMM